MAKSFPTWKSVLGAVAVSGVALLAAAPPALAQDGGGGSDPTQAPAQERVSASVQPGVVRMKMEVAEGYLVNPSTGQAFLAPAGGGCTGFTLSSDGYIGTAGHCVDPDIYAAQARKAVAEAIASSDGSDADADYAALQSWVYAGDPAGETKPTIRVALAPATATGNDKVMEAQIVEAQPFVKGDVALLKVDGHDMMTVPMGPNEPVAVGTPITSIGYPGVREDIMDKSLTPTYESGTVTSQQSKDGIAYTEISAIMGHGMSGGPTVNQQGQVVGINSQGTGDDGGAYNYIAPISRLNEMMARKGVHNEPSAIDTAYRAGLADYYQGYYSDAQEEFDKVLALSPGNRPAQDFKSKATKAHDQFGDKGLGVMTWSLIGGGAALVLIAGGVTIVLARRRNGGGEAPVQVPGAPMPTGPAPQGFTAAPQQQWGTTPAQGTAQPFGPTYSTSVPNMPQNHQQAQPFGSAPFGETQQVVTGPQSPAVGIPAQVAPAQAGQAGQAAPATTNTGPIPVQVANGYCVQCGAGRAAGSRFCGACGVGVS